MTLRRFDSEMQDLNLDIIRLGNLIEDAINMSTKALLNKDLELAQAVIKKDKDINILTNKIESEALKILLIEHPVASDLRNVSTALKIVTDMERIGDQASDISEIVNYLSDKDYSDHIKLIIKMANITNIMVKSSVDAFVKKDYDLAEDIIKMDNDVDKLFLHVKDDMVALIKSDSENADEAIYLMMIAKYFEKIGDHAENIAQWIQFAKTGKRKNVRLI